LGAGWEALKVIYETFRSWDALDAWIGRETGELICLGNWLKRLRARLARRSSPDGHEPYLEFSVYGALGAATVGGLEQDKGGVGLRCRIVFISWRGYVAKVFLGFGVGAGVLRLREGTNEGCEGGFQQ
jgi:hypothetical protein